MRFLLRRTCDHTVAKLPKLCSRGDYTILRVYVGQLEDLRFRDDDLLGDLIGYN